MLFFFISIGCSQNKTAEQLLTSAQRYIEEENKDAAIIELKNVIQLDASNGEARVMLGKIYLSSGQAVNAEKEFKRADEYNFNPDDFYTLYARALFLQSKSEDILYLDVASLDNAESKAALLYYQGISAYQKGENDTAEKMLNDSKNSSNTSIFGKLSATYLYLIKNKFDDALSSINDIHLTHADNLDVISLKARILSNLNQNAEALSLFEKYLNFIIFPFISLLIYQ